jgi:hypothetical protein
LELLGNDEVHGDAGSGADDAVDVERSFGLKVGRRGSGIGIARGDDDGGNGGGKAGVGLVLGDIGVGDARLADDGDTLGLGADGGAFVAAVVDGVDIEDEGEVAGGDVVGAVVEGEERMDAGGGGGAGGREGSLDGVGLIERLDFELAEALDGADEGGERGGDGGLGDGGEARGGGETFAGGSGGVEDGEGGVEGVAEDGGRAGGVEDDSAGGDGVDLEALAGEPAGEGGEVVGGGAVERADLLRCQPLVIERGAGGLLVGEELGESGFDGGVAVEDERDVEGGAEVDGAGGTLRAALDPAGELVAELGERSEVRVGGDAICLGDGLDGGDCLGAKLELAKIGRRVGRSVRRTGMRPSGR